MKIKIVKFTDGSYGVRHKNIFGCCGFYTKDLYLWSGYLKNPKLFHHTKEVAENIYKRITQGEVNPFNDVGTPIKE